MKLAVVKMWFNSKIGIKQLKLGLKLALQRNPHIKRENGETHGIGTDCPEYVDR